MTTENETMPAALRQLLVDAAAALEDLTDEALIGEPGRRIAGRLRDAAAGKPLTRKWFVRVTTAVEVTLPYEIDPSTPEGDAAVMEAIPGMIVDNVDENAFNVECEECDE